MKQSKRGRQAEVTRWVQHRQGAAAEAARQEAIGGQPGGGRASWGGSGAAGGASGAAVEPTASDPPIARNPEAVDLSLLSWRTSLDMSSRLYQSPMGDPQGPGYYPPGLAPRPCSTSGEPLLPRRALSLTEDLS